MRYGWSLDRNIWAKLPLEFIADSEWRSVGLSSSDANSVSTNPGVYAICASPLSRNRSTKVSPNDLFGHLFNTLYIGQAINLRERFNDHSGPNATREVKEARMTYQGSLEFWFCRLPVQEIGAMEIALIDCFGPTANLVRGSIRGKLRSPLSVDSGWGKSP